MDRRAWFKIICYNLWTGGPSPTTDGESMQSSCVGVEKDKQMPVAFVFCITFTTSHTPRHISNAKLSAYRFGSVMVSPVCYRSAIWRVVIRLEPCSRTQPPPPPPSNPPNYPPPQATHPTHPTHPPPSFSPILHFLIKKLTQQQ